MAFAEFYYRNKKRTLLLERDTTLYALKQTLCDLFLLSLTEPDWIELHETSLTDQSILVAAVNWTTIKEIILADANSNLSFLVFVREAPPSPSPSPLPAPYVHRVKSAKPICGQFEKLHQAKEDKMDVEDDENEDIKNAEIDASYEDAASKLDVASTIIQNVTHKLKMELNHSFRSGKQQVPIKSRAKLFNFLLSNNGKTLEKNVDKQTLHNIIEKVATWWFDIGLKTIALGGDYNHALNNEMKITDLMMKNFENNKISTRDYQFELFEHQKRRNIICFMPTGSGKTRIAIKFIEHRLKVLYLKQLEMSHSKDEKKEKKHILFLVCTTHLAEQQKRAIYAALPFIKCRKIIGANNPDVWQYNEWKIELDYYDVLVMMHDCLIAALSHGYIKMNNIDTLIFDECHHVVGNKSNQSHPYTVIMDKYFQFKQSKQPKQTLPRIMGLTASPIKTRESDTGCISQKAEQLQRKMDAIIMRVEGDELRAIVSNPQTLFYYYLKTCMSNVRTMSIPPVFKQKLPKYEKLLSNFEHVVEECGVYGAAVTMRLVNDKLQQNENRYLVKSPYGDETEQELREKEKAMALFKIFVAQRVKFFDNQLKNRYDANEWCFDADISMKLLLLIKFISDSHSCIKGEMMESADKWTEMEFNANCFNNVDSTKQQGIIFVEQRIIAYVLQFILSMRFNEIKFGVLTGHSAQSGLLWGMNDKKQGRVIDQFRNGDIDYLIATSVAEEGIDIKACNCVIRYTLPSTVKTFIQSRGRARNIQSKLVLFLSNQKEMRSVQQFVKNEQAMIRHAQQSQSERKTIDSEMNYDKYEYKVDETEAFASTVNAMSMLNRYFDYLKIRKSEIIRFAIKNANGTKCTLIIKSKKWKLKRREFANIGENEKEAEKKVAVDMIQALREGGEWNVNLVPVDILRRNEQTMKLQRDRALFKSVQIKKVRVAEVLMDDFVQNDDIKGYLYHIDFNDDNKSFPIGILFPKPLPDALLDHIRFPIQTKERNIQTLAKDVDEYVHLVHEGMSKLNEDIPDNEEDKEDEKQILDKPQTAINDEEEKAELNKKERVSNYIKNKVSLRAASKNNAVSISPSNFNQMKRYHHTVFTLLDRGGSKKKKKLEQMMEEDEKETRDHERFYLICPLKQYEDKYAINDFRVDWDCINQIVAFDTAFKEDKLFPIDHDIKHELIQTRRDDEKYMYISFGINRLFSCSSLIPVPGQIIADKISENQRIKQILNSDINIKLSENQRKQKYLSNTNEDEIDLLDADVIDVNAAKTQLNQLKTVRVSDIYPVPPGQNVAKSDHVVITRMYSPKITNILSIDETKKSKMKKTKLKSSIRFVPLRNIFRTGISFSHLNKLLCLPPILWRIENFSNIYDAQSLLCRKCNGVLVDFDLLLEALCNVNSGTNKSYEKLECLGDRVLKYLVAMHGIFTNTDFNEGDLTLYSSNIVSNLTLDKASTALHLPSYGIFNQFHFSKWHPPFFKPRDNESLYENVRISLKLPADLIESTLAALFLTFSEHLSVGFNACHCLLRELKLLPSPFKIDEKYKQLIDDWDSGMFDTIHTKKEIQSRLRQISDLLSEKMVHHRLQFSNPIVTASLIELIDKSYQYHHSHSFEEYGISYQRLEFLGDAILDIIVTQYLFDDPSVDGSEHGSIEGQMTALRSKIVGNDALAFNFQDHNFDEAIIWPYQQQEMIDAYKEGIFQLEESLLESNFEEWWYLKVKSVKAPKCLGDAFEVLMAIIFINSNLQMLFNSGKCEWDLSECAEFLCCFHDYADMNWTDMSIEWI